MVIANIITGYLERTRNAKSESTGLSYNSLYKRRKQRATIVFRVWAVKIDAYFSGISDIFEARSSSSLRLYMIDLNSESFIRLWSW